MGIRELLSIVSIGVLKPESAGGPFCTRRLYPGVQPGTNQWRDLPSIGGQQTCVLSIQLIRRRESFILHNVPVT